MLARSLADLFAQALIGRSFRTCTPRKRGAFSQGPRKNSSALARLRCSLAHRPARSIAGSGAGPGPGIGPGPGPGPGVGPGSGVGGGVGAGDGGVGSGIGGAGGPGCGPGTGEGIGGGDGTGGVGGVVMLSRLPAPKWPTVRCNRGAIT
jgi:hypothetical protein